MDDFLQNPARLPHNLYSYHDEYVKVQVHVVCSRTWLSLQPLQSAVAALTLTACYWEGASDLKQFTNISVIDGICVWQGVFRTLEVSLYRNAVST